MPSPQGSDTIRVLVGMRDDARRDALASQLAAFDDVIVVGRHKDARRVVTDLQGAALDLVFLDRAMLTPRDMRELRKALERGLPLIAFVITQPQPVDTFEPNAIDYLVVPASKHRTRTTIERAKERLEVLSAAPRLVEASDAGAARMSESAVTSKFIQRIPARTADGFRIIAVEELVSAVARSEYLHLTTTSGDRHVILHTLKDLEAKLDPATFIRLSRSTLVNISFVRHVMLRRSGELTVALSNGEEHEASRRRARELRERLLRL